MWEKIIAWLSKEALGLSFKQWGYVFIVAALIASHGCAYYKGVEHEKNVVDQATTKALTKEQDQERKDAKEAVKNADEASTKLDNQEKKSKEDEAKAHELSKDSNCPKSDAERDFLRKRVDEANKNK